MRATSRLCAFRRCRNQGVGNTQPYDCKQPPGAGGLGPIGLWCLGERLVELYGIVAILVCPPPTVWTRRSQEL